jgi:hypothetical protein
VYTLDWKSFETRQGQGMFSIPQDAQTCSGALLLNGCRYCFARQEEDPLHVADRWAVASAGFMDCTVLYAVMASWEQVYLINNNSNNNNNNKGNVKSTLEQVTKAHRRSRGIALPFL